MTKSVINENPSFLIETDFLFQGKKVIAGLDEAGRGSLAGPLTVASVVFPCEFFSEMPPQLSDLNDSKKLTPRKREACYEVIKKYAAYYSYIHISPEIIDEMNINRATEFAVNKLLERNCEISQVLLDGNFKFNLKIPYLSVIKGDSRSITIAAASIVAKVERDAFMSGLPGKYDIYGFKKNAGYGTVLHRESIMKHGPSDIHRKSYEPCRTITGYGKDNIR
ncbi:MAG: ribonuclease HII [Spirochaetes bacterium]|nr:ribonuclease HII [Spirochaetota bacterium]